MITMKNICGMDEAGRGPLAGPVTAAAVILPDDFPFEILNDSKKLSEKKRENAAKMIKEKAISWAVCFINHKIIDEINILNASLLAMQKAFEAIYENNVDTECVLVGGVFPYKEIQQVIVDGLYVPSIHIEKEKCLAKPKADATEYSVMAASILAKTERDRVMIEYDGIYPEYLYKKHKGYPTKLHREICHRIGPSPIQRLTFKY